MGDATIKKLGLMPTTLNNIAPRNVHVMPECTRRNFQWNLHETNSGF